MVDRRAALNKGLNPVFVKIPTGQNLSVFYPAFIEDTPDVTRMSSQITAI
jgi:hypothetical protein